MTPQYCDAGTSKKKTKGLFEMYEFLIMFSPPIKVTAQDLNLVAWVRLIWDGTANQLGALAGTGSGRKKT